jgi:putative ABC transport system permease protein
MENLIKDIRYGVRLLLKNPGFTAIAVVALALGIGANTAIFTVVNAVMLRALPYPSSERLVAMRPNQSLPDLADIEARSQAFEGVGAVVMQGQDYTGGSEPVQVQAALVNAGFFSVLGATPVHGRVLSAEEDNLGGAPVVVLGNGFWKRYMGADPNVVGRAIPLSGKSYTVIGVLSEDFVVPRPQRTGTVDAEPDLFASLQVVNPLAAGARGVHFLQTFWRLKPEVTIAEAQAEMVGIDQQLAEEYPDENKGHRRLLVPLRQRLVGETKTALLVLFGAVGMVLLIACANFANLLLAQGASRRREIVVRSALGAGRWRLVRQMLTESVIVSLAGGALGLVLAMWGSDLLVALKPASLPRLTGVRIDSAVLLFTLGVSVLTGIVFGLMPALSVSRADLNEVLKEGGRSATHGRASRRLRSALVVSEVAIALVLLIGAGLLIRSFQQLRSVEPGFAIDNITTMRIELPEARYREIPKQVQFRSRLLDELNAQPGFQAAMISELPLSGDLLTHNFIIEGRPALAPGDEPEIFTRTASRGYFDTMGIPLIGGRDFTSQDRFDSMPVCIVNESTVEQYFPGENPIGARIRWARGNQVRWFTIVGVARDVKQFDLEAPEQPAVYTLWEQQDQIWKRWTYLVVRSNTTLATVADQAKQAVWNVDSQLPVMRIQPMSEVMATSIAGQRFNMLLLGIFAAVGLALAAVGIYGVISYSVTQRTHEIGIRMALGAQPGQIFKLVVGQGLRLALIGTAIGLVLALGATKVMSTLLFGITATDPATFVVIGLIAALLLLVALLASYIPARRAAKVDPMTALRYE